jgi:hypothetical protein
VNVFEAASAGWTVTVNDFDFVFAGINTVFPDSGGRPVIE